MTDYDLKESKVIKLQFGGYGHICPECFDHKQGRIRRVVDCKNEFYKIINGRSFQTQPTVQYPGMWSPEQAHRSSGRVHIPSSSAHSRQPYETATSPKYHWDRRYHTSRNRYRKLPYGLSESGETLRY